MRTRTKSKWMAPSAHARAWLFIDCEGKRIGSVLPVGNVIFEWKASRGERVLAKGNTRSLVEAKRRVEAAHEGKQ